MVSNAKKFSIGRALALVGILFILIFSIGAMMYFQSITAISVWIPMLCSLAVSGLAGAVLWRLWTRLTGSQSFLPNFLSHLLFFTFVLTGLYYIINYAGASKERIEKVEIASRYREQHYQSRRVGKNRYVRGNPYCEYYINVILPSGKEKKLQIPYSAYSRMKSGMEINLSFSKGCLGGDVINVKDIISDNPDLRAPAKRKRCRFVGTR